MEYLRLWLPFTTSVVRITPMLVHRIGRISPELVYIVLLSNPDSLPWMVRTPYILDLLNLNIRTLAFHIRLYHLEAGGQWSYEPRSGLAVSKRPYFCTATLHPRLKIDHDLCTASRPRASTDNQWDRRVRLTLSVGQAGILSRLTRRVMDTAEDLPK